MTNTIAATEWTWLTWPIDPAPAFDQIVLQLRVLSGDVEVDTVLLGAGVWPLSAWPEPGLTLPAASFFRAGYSHDDGASVVLRAGYDPDRVLFYGPQYPFPPGDYIWEITFSSPAARGVELARAGMYTTADPAVQDWTVIRAGEPARIAWRASAGVPASLHLHYLRHDDLTIHAVTIRRAAEPWP